jgi:predicted amidohydrolase
MGRRIPIFGRDQVPFGMAICADISNETVFAECARQGARIVIELAAPGLNGDQSSRDWRSGFEWWKGECHKYLRRYAEEYKIWIAVATQAGRTVDEDFPGGGYIFAPDGRCMVETLDWSTRAVYLEIDLDLHRVMSLPSSPIQIQRTAPEKSPGTSKELGRGKHYMFLT